MFVLRAHFYSCVNGQWLNLTRNNWHCPGEGHLRSDNELAATTSNEVSSSVRVRLLALLKYPLAGTELQRVLLILALDLHALQNTKTIVHWSLPKGHFFSFPVLDVKLYETLTIWNLTIRKASSDDDAWTFFVPSVSQERCLTFCIDIDLLQNTSIRLRKILFSPVSLYPNTVRAEKM